MLNIVETTVVHVFFLCHLHLSVETVLDSYLTWMRGPVIGLFALVIHMQKKSLVYHLPVT